MKRILTITLTFLFLFALFAETIYAIPAFARKYRMSCTTCHSPAPRLKPYGDEFAGNGFVLSDKDAPRYYVDTGDDELSLIREFPVAARLEGMVTYNNNNSEKSDFNAPYNLKLLSGGEFAPDVAYYFYFFLSERGEVAGIEDAYIMFNDLFNTELDLYVGQFQVSDPLFKRELRLTFDDYDIYKTKIGASRINLAYDRGIMLTYGFETGTDVILEVLNGTGIGDADGLRNFDFDEYKNIAGRVSQDIGENLRIGAFGYYGKEALTQGGDEFTNEVWYLGPDFTLSYQDMIELNFQYLMRDDSEPVSRRFYQNATDIQTKSFMTELIFMPDGDFSKWYAVGLYNWQESDIMGYNISKATAHLGWVLRRNLRLFGEFTFDIENEFSQLGVGFVSAF